LTFLVRPLSWILESLAFWGAVLEMNTSVKGMLSSMKLEHSSSASITQRDGNLSDSCEYYFHTFILLLHIRSITGLRYDCPTSGNAAESIHAKLDALKHRCDVFARLVMEVFSYSVRRYSLRNSEERRNDRVSNKFITWSETPLISEKNLLINKESMRSVRSWTMFPSWPYSQAKR
jgi:hypothetical protein